MFTFNALVFTGFYFLWAYILPIIPGFRSTLQLIVSSQITTHTRRTSNFKNYLNRLDKEHIEIKKQIYIQYRLL